MTTKGAGPNGRRNALGVAAAMQLEDLLAGIGVHRELIDDRRRVLDDLADDAFAAGDQIAVVVIAKAGQITHPETDACIYKGALTVSSESGANCLILNYFTC